MKYIMRINGYCVFLLLFYAQSTNCVVSALSASEVSHQLDTQSSTSNNKRTGYSYSFDKSTAETTASSPEYSRTQQVLTTLISLAQNRNIPNIEELLVKCHSIEMMEQVFAILMAYYPHTVQGVAWNKNDVVFTINGTEIWYAGGRLLSTSRLEEKDKYKRILYPYRTEAITEIFHEIPQPAENFSKEYIRASDFQVAILGGRPAQIEPYIREVRILGIRVRLHPYVAAKAQLASEKVMRLAQQDKSLATFISDLKTISGFVDRKVKNSVNISMHAFGIAFDFIPYKYYGKQTYWLWTKDLDPENWQKKALHKRWLIPQQIVEAFEEQGFIWGGKWPNYDTMHFEYKPELIAYANARKATGSPSIWGITSSDKEDLHITIGESRNNNEW